MKSVVAYDEQTETLLLGCDCTCTLVEFKVTDYHDVKEYYLSFYGSSFYADQGSFFSRLKDKLRLIKQIIFDQKFRYQEICIPEEDFNRFKELVNKLR